jgi:hypothetical protein
MCEHTTLQMQHMSHHPGDDEDENEDEDQQDDGPLDAHQTTR